jgi:hypothetical protein
MRTIRGWLCAAVAVLAIGAASRVEALPQLQLSISDGINPTVLLIDTLGTGGLVHVGAIGDWIFNVTSGTGYPITGTPDNPLIDFNSINVSNTSGGTLTMMLTEIGLTSNEPTGLFAAAIGGTVSINPGSQLAYMAYTDSTNAPFGTESVIGNAVFGGGSFAYSNTTVGQTGALYSITQVVTLTALPGSNNTNISFNGELRSVPEPASMLVLGAGLVALGIAKRRKA